MGGAAGAALIGGLTSGFAQGRRQAEDRAIQDEYKKVLMSKAKNDIEMHMLDQQDMQAASEGDQRALMRLLIKKDPMMAFAMSGQQGGQPQQPEVNIGMNYEEPAAPQTQVTFPAQLTGVPQMGSFDKERFMAHKLYGQTTNPADITGSDILLHPELQIPVRVPRDRRGYRWDLAQAVPPNIVRETEAGGPTGSQKSAYSGTTGRKIEAIPPIPQPVEIVRETVTNPDGSQSIIEVPKYPVQGQPQPQNRTKPTLGPKPGQPIQFDNKETLDEYVKTFGGGGGGIQTKPAQNEMVIPTEKLGDYYNPIEGKFLSDHPEARAMTQNKRSQLGYKEVPKLSEEQKGKFSGTVIALDEMLPRVYKEMFPGGKFSAKVHNDVKKIASSNKMLNELGGGTVGEAVYKDLIESAEAWVRAKTGATMNPAEIEQAAKTFVGQWLSNSTTVKRGLDNLKSLLEGFAKSHDPKGVYRDIETRKETVVDGKTYIRLKGQWFEKR